MSMPRYPLTPELQSAICGYILSGGYPHVAAEAAGVPREVFDSWLRRARARRPKKKYRLFFEAIMQARAQVRLAAGVAAAVRCAVDRAAVPRDAGPPARRRRAGAPRRR